MNGRCRRRWRPTSARSASYPRPAPRTGQAWRQSRSPREQHPQTGTRLQQLGGPAPSHPAGSRRPLRRGRSARQAVQRGWSANLAVRTYASRPGARSPLANRADLKLGHSDVIQGPHPDHTIGGRKSVSRTVRSVKSGTVSQSSRSAVCSPIHVRVAIQHRTPTRRRSGRG